MCQLQSHLLEQLGILLQSPVWTRLCGWTLSQKSVTPRFGVVRSADRGKAQWFAKICLNLLKYPSWLISPGSTCFSVSMAGNAGKVIRTSGRAPSMAWNLDPKPDMRTSQAPPLKTLRTSPYNFNPGLIQPWFTNRRLPIFTPEKKQKLGVTPQFFINEGDWSVGDIAQTVQKTHRMSEEAKT